VRSELFRRLWAGHPVRNKGHATARILHPVVGAMDLSYEALRLPDDPDQVVVTYSAPRSSEAGATLRLLASWYADARPTG
jgi:hypothetical protein